MIIACVIGGQLITGKGTFADGDTSTSVFYAMLIGNVVTIIMCMIFAGMKYGEAVKACGQGILEMIPVAMLLVFAFCLSGIRYLRHRTLSYFLLICFYGCFALGSLYWTLYLLLFSETPRIFLCIGIRLGLQRYFSLSPTIYSLLPGGKKLFLSEIPAGSADRSSVVRILLYLW